MCNSQDYMPTTPLPLVGTRLAPSASSGAQPPIGPSLGPGPIIPSPAPNPIHPGDEIPNLTLYGHVTDYNDPHKVKSTMTVTYTGSGAPSYSKSRGDKSGDIYLDTTNGQLYVLVDGDSGEDPAWSLVSLAGGSGSGPVSAVEHSDFANTDALGDRYNLGDVKAKVNEVLSKLKGVSACVVAVLCLSLSADVTVHSARLDSIYSDSTVVTGITANVTSPSVVTNIAEFVVSTNGFVKAAALSAYQTKIDDYTTTNAVANLITNNVAAWAMYGQSAPVTDISSRTTFQNVTNIAEYVASTNLAGYPTFPQVTNIVVAVSEPWDLMPYMTTDEKGYGTWVASTDPVEMVVVYEDLGGHSVTDTVSSTVAYFSSMELSNGTQTFFVRMNVPFGEFSSIVQFPIQSYSKSVILNDYRMSIPLVLESRSGSILSAASTDGLIVYRSVTNLVGKVSSSVDGAPSVGSKRLVTSDGVALAIDKALSGISAHGVTTNDVTNIVHSSVAGWALAGNDAPSVDLSSRATFSSVTNIAEYIVGTNGFLKSGALSGYQRMISDYTTTNAVTNLIASKVSSWALVGADPPSQYDVSSRTTFSQASNIADYVVLSKGYVNQVYLSERYQTKIPDYTSTNAVSNIVSALVTDYVSGVVTNVNPDFSNAVLSVGIGITTNEVAEIRSVISTFSDMPVGTGATTLGGLLLAIAGLAVWLKKHTVKTDGESDQTIEGSVTVGDLYVGGTKVAVVSSVPDDPVPDTLYFVTGGQS